MKSPMRLTTSAGRAATGSADPLAGLEEKSFHSLEMLLGCPVLTKDGEKCSVSNFLFDDRSWQIRYMVVDVGRWFSARQVVIPASAVQVPDWTKPSMSLDLTREELLQCPAADTVRPVSRQQQIAWKRYFGWPENSSYWGAPASTDPASREFAVSGPDDPHLRRTQDLTSYQIWGTNGFLGLLEGFFLEEGSWHIGYLVVRAGDWIYREQLVSTDNVTGISWRQRRVQLGCRRDAAQEQPAW